MFIRRPILQEEQQDEGGTAAVASTPDPEDRTQEFIEAIDAYNASEEGETSSTEVDDSTTVTTDEPEDAVETETASTDAPARKRDANGRFVKAEQPAEESAAEESNDSTSTAEEFQQTLTSTENFLTEELREMGASYGLTDEVMLSQGSEESLRNAMELIDRYEANRSGIRRQPEPEEQVAPQQEAAPPAPEPPAQPDAPTEESQANFETYIQNLKDNGYDEEVTKPLEALYQQNQQLMQQMEGLQNHAHQVQQGAVQNYQNQVLGLIDNLGREDLFGNDSNFTPDQQRNAQEMDKAVQFLTQTQGLPLNKATVSRAFNLTFGDQLMHERQVQRANAVKKQSKTRMGSGAPTEPREDIQWDGDPGEDPVIKAFFNNAMQENGYR